jgi:hypothetical protein
MIVEILLAINILVLLRILKAVKGPEIVYHRRKRLQLFLERIKTNVADIIERVRSFIR